MEFIRYGNLIPQQHDRPTNENDWTFHTPPCEYGFYAFPKGFVELYLLGGIGSGNVRNGRFKFLKDENGDKIYVKFGDFFSEEYDDKTYKNYVKDKWLPLLKKNGLTYNDVAAYVEDEDGVASNDWFQKFEKVNIAISNKPNCFKYNGLIWHHFIEAPSSDLMMVKPNEIIKRRGQWILTDIKTYEKALKKYTSIIKYNRMRGNTTLGSPNGFPISYFDKDVFEVYIEKVN